MLQPVATLIAGMLLAAASPRQVDVGPRAPVE
jgi:hypothetical protein